jgi:hypothetical protein
MALHLSNDFEMLSVCCLHRALALALYVSKAARGFSLGALEDCFCHFVDEPLPCSAVTLPGVKHREGGP